MTFVARYGYPMRAFAQHRRPFPGRRVLRVLLFRSLDHLVQLHMTLRYRLPDLLLHRYYRNWRIATQFTEHREWCG